MQRKSVGLVTYLKSPKLTKGDQLLVKPLEKQGYVVSATPWNDKTINWEDFDILILRSCWNYHRKLTEFNEWLSSIEKKGITLWNPYKIVRWNIHKEYLLDLEQKGISIISTSILRQNSDLSLRNIFEETGYPELVIKPAVGASGKGVIRIKENEISAKQKIFTQMVNSQDYLIQPYMNEINDGELSLIFFNKNYSHCVLKHPSPQAFNPSQQVIDEARKIFACIPDTLLYTRIDGLIIKNKFVLMELELIEPMLFFEFSSGSAERFAKTFASLIISSHSN